ncbi:MAG TPA: hypothetical protein VFA12_05175 [Stellaceae bacterium]|nr:hypothetical protein [Stellaceae bacterium]
MDEDNVLSFVRATIRSAWSLELLLLMRRSSRATWSVDALVRELRGSPALVVESLGALESAGLVVAADNGECVYRPQTPQLEEAVDALAELYASKPLTVLHTIFTTPSAKIRSFSDAFLFKKK